MQSFKQFLKEVKTTKRKGIQHLEKMKESEFLDLIEYIKNDLQGKLDNVTVNLKMDGLGFRVGRDESGSIFVEGSRTGPIFRDKAFSDFTKSQGKNEQAIARAEHYDDILDHFKNSSLLNDVPNDTKIIMELLYNPLGEFKEGGIQFVKVSYDRSKLGSLMTIIPIDVIVASTGEPHPQSNDIFESLLSKSNSKVKVASNRLDITGEIDINAVVDPLKSLDIEESKRILKSRKKADKEEKQKLIEIITQVKEDLAEFLANNDKIVDKERFGTESEGLVFTINDELIKITSNDFRTKMAQDK